LTFQIRRPASSSRPDSEPFRVETSFNNTAAPRTLLRMTMTDYLGMQDGSQNGQLLRLRRKDFQDRNGCKGRRKVSLCEL
jgi:hypothetical protein